MRADVELWVVDLPRTLARVSQLLAHRFGVVEELNVRRVNEAGGRLRLVLDGPERRIGFLISHFERLVGVTAVSVRPARASVD